MKIHVGSKNITKVAGVRDAVALYPKLFPEPEVIGIDVQVEEFGHPKNIEETIEGAIERAKKAFNSECTYGVGVEGGLIEIPRTHSGYMEVGACAIYDGNKIALGLSPAYEWPKNITEMILSGGTDASTAFKKLGYTEHKKIGNVPGGIIGALTDGKMPREEFTKYSVMMAVIQIEKKNMY